MSSFALTEKHAVEIKRIPLWELIFLECVKFRHGDTDEEKISYAGSRYGGFRDVWFPRDKDVPDVRELRTWRWIIRCTEEQWFQSFRSEMWVLPPYLNAFEISCSGNMSRVTFDACISLFLRPSHRQRRSCREAKITTEQQQWRTQYVYRTWKQ